jgi:dUTPase
MADDAVLEKIQDDTREAGLRLRASLSLLHSQGVIDDDYRELALCLRTSLAMVEAAYMEARKRG